MKYANPVQKCIWSGVLLRCFTYPSVLIPLRPVIFRIKFDTVKQGWSIIYMGNIGGSRISGKGVYIYKGVGVHFAEFISFF